MRNCKVKSTGLAAIRFTQNFGVRLEAAKNFRRAVGRTVINHDDFSRFDRIVLRQNTGKRFFDEALVIVGINQYANKWCGHVSILRRKARQMIHPAAQVCRRDCRDSLLRRKRRIVREDQAFG